MIYDFWPFIERKGWTVTLFLYNILSYMIFMIYDSWPFVKRKDWTVTLFLYDILSYVFLKIIYLTWNIGKIAKEVLDPDKMLESIKNKKYKFRKVV
jgi:hypothetical protein